MSRAAASPREAAPPQVCALWTDLLARLSLALVASGQAQARAQLRSLGVRRLGTVAANLRRELSMAHRMADSAGAPVAAPDLQRRIGELAQPKALADHLADLASSYRHLALDASVPAAGPLGQWLAGRQRVHQVQLETMEPGQGWRRRVGPGRGGT